ncbi:MAG: DUF4350 domain-containing protein [Fimbriimonadales bacterium]|nr:DUF4350 domain-containing protein [Fimbriimonadales bacterium]
MRFLRERFGLIVIIGVVVGLLLYSLRLAQEAQDPRYAPLPLSYSQHRLGAKGLARLLERNGYTVRSFKRTFRYLPKDASMLIIFPIPNMGPTTTEWTQEDADALDSWLRRGGRLLLISGDQRLPESLREDSLNRLPSFLFPAQQFIDTAPVQPFSWLGGVQQVRLADQRVNLTPRSERWVPLLHTGGAIEAAFWYYDKGLVLECTDWQWLTNEHLRDTDNGAFILAAVRKMLPQGGVIYFDDAGQGDLQVEQEARGFWSIAPTGVRVAFTHLLILTVLVMYSVGKRLGLPRPTPPRTPALGEYVDALAGVYERAEAAQPALETVLESVRRRLCRQFGLPAGATLLQLIQALPANSPLHTALVEAHRALQNPNLTAEEAIRILKKLQF